MKWVKKKFYRLINVYMYKIRTLLPCWVFAIWLFCWTVLLFFLYQSRHTQGEISQDSCIYHHRILVVTYVSCHVSPAFIGNLLWIFYTEVFSESFSPIFSNIRKQLQRFIEKPVIHLRWGVLQKKNQLRWSHFLVKLLD